MQKKRSKYPLEGWPVRYQPLRVLGKGHDGVCYLCEDVQLHCLVAVKVLNPKRNRKVTEPYFMKGLNHKHIVRVHDHMMVGTFNLLVLEYCERGDLCDYVYDHERLDEDLARKIMLQLVRGVRYLHEHGICHRDLKLDNIFLDRHFQVKIGDFGASCSFDQETKLTYRCGTTQYNAPELVKNQGYFGDEVDCWALGVILYVMLIGKFPFDCLRAADQQILTNAGFLFLDEVEQRVERRRNGTVVDWRGLRVANYNATTQQLVYEQPRRLVVKAARDVERFLAFCPSQRHAADAVIAVTDNHNMYISTANSDSAPFVKRRAAEFVDRDGDDGASFRMLTRAANGVAANAIAARREPPHGVDLHAYGACVDDAVGFADWLWAASRDNVRLVLAGVTAARGAHFSTRSALFCEQCVRAYLHAGFAAPALEKRADGSWVVDARATRSSTSSSSSSSSSAQRTQQWTVRSEPADSRAWCFDMNGGFVVTRRAQRAANRRDIERAAAPIIVGNCDSDMALLWQIIKGIKFPALPTLSEEVKDLIRTLTEPEPSQRATLTAILEHPWIQPAVRSAIDDDYDDAERALEEARRKQKKELYSSSEDEHSEASASSSSSSSSSTTSAVSSLPSPLVSRSLSSSGSPRPSSSSSSSSSVPIVSDNKVSTTADIDDGGTSFASPAVSDAEQEDSEMGVKLSAKARSNSGKKKKKNASKSVSKSASKSSSKSSEGKASKRTSSSGAKKKKKRSSGPEVSDDDDDDDEDDDDDDGDGTKLNSSDKKKKKKKVRKFGQTK